MRVVLYAICKIISTDCLKFEFSNNIKSAYYNLNKVREMLMNASAVIM